MGLPTTAQEDAAKIGDALRRWRLVHDLPARVVADRAGISLDTLRSLERGDGTGARFGAVLAVARVLGIQERIFDAVEPLNTELGLLRADRMRRKRAPR
ncbi:MULTISPECIES: helix-turn-helix domain-containing protein [unclassified Leucobacter]|uniref:helix-turn-helix domain-containing protein n=1 Tax=unclassified Leucobacter TaxID=2621730 RepID=UPI000A94848B|nr:helix-turn-helix transcriptional regulator [Leucobacter sp. Ag1]